MHKAIFLDRDGTINEDVGYAHAREEWHFLPGVVEALAGFKKAGFLLVVVSNQSGIGRGYYNKCQVDELHDWVNEQLREWDAAIDAWYYCPHTPWDECDCRKPLPNLIQRAARELHIDLGESYMIGDRPSDAQAGLAAGCKAGIVGGEKMPGVAAWPNLLAAMGAIVGKT